MEPLGTDIPTIGVVIDREQRLKYFIIMLYLFFIVLLL